MERLNQKQSKTRKQNAFDYVNIDNIKLFDTVDQKLDQKLDKLYESISDKDLETNSQDSQSTELAAAPKFIEEDYVQKQD